MKPRDFYDVERFKLLAVAEVIILGSDQFQNWIKILENPSLKFYLLNSFYGV